MDAKPAMPPDLPKPTDADKAADLDAGKAVLTTEADALKQAAESLGNDFAAAVEALYSTEGRVIVSGLGKSGHIARKTAATFASTGTPAHYVHPSEASHGDLGMITAADTLLMFSNSGENRELSDMLVHSRRFSIPLVAVTSRPESTLATQSDIVLALPNAPEACPMGLAPTTSTTLMIAYGDALAVALMGRRGFDKDDYRVLHPGGALGAALVRVRDIMHKDDALPLVGEDALMSETLLTMTAKGFGCAGVIDKDGQLAGIVTDGDLRRHMSGDLLTSATKDVMTKNPQTIEGQALVAEAIHLMNEGTSRPITTLFVTKDGHCPIGIIHLHDCLRVGAK